MPERFSVSVSVSIVSPYRFRRSAAYWWHDGPMTDTKPAPASDREGAAPPLSQGKSAGSTVSKPNVCQAGVSGGT